MRKLVSVGWTGKSAERRIPVAEQIEKLLTAEFAEYLRERGVKVTRGPKGYTGLCPAHADETPSLSFRDGTKRVLVKCFTGCSQDEILDAVGLTFRTSS